MDRITKLTVDHGQGPPENSNLQMLAHRRVVVHVGVQVVLKALENREAPSN